MSVTDFSESENYGLQSELDSGDGHMRSQNRLQPLLSQYLRSALRRKWIIIATLIAFVATGLIVTLLITPQYFSAATIEISRESSKIVNVEGVEPDSAQFDQEFYQTQYGLLQSRALAERVVTDLKLFENYDFFEQFGAIADDDVFVDGKLRRPLTAEQRVEQTRKAANILLANIDVTPERGSSLVDVGFMSPSPALSARVANSWVENFIESSLARRFDATAYAREFLEKRLAEVKAELEESERNAVSYASRERLIGIPQAQLENGDGGGEVSLIASDLAAINRALSAAKADRLRAESRVNTSGNGNATDLALENPAISGLRQKRAETAAELAKQLATFEEDYPTVVALRSQIEQFDASIKREENRVRDSIRNDYSAALEQERKLTSRLEQLKQGVVGEKNRGIQLNIYQRDVDTNRQLYDALLQRFKEVGVAGGIGVNNISIVDTARIPQAPAKPNLFLNLLIALFFGTVFAALITIILEHLDESVSDPSEVEAQLDRPLLGVIPKGQGDNLIEELVDPKSVLHESYLSLLTNLSFTTSHGVPRTLSVTSSRAAEGKSTTAYSIANLLKRSGKKVVIVDADMRSPSVHHNFLIKNDRGLSTYLSGDDNVSSLLHVVSDESPVVMTAGVSPPNAAELLSSDRFANLLETLQTDFDHVIIDSPPVLGLADAPLIARAVDGVLFTIESNTTRTRAARAAIDRLFSARANILGVVVSKFDDKQSGYGYGYGYSYDYTYGGSASS